MPHIDVSRHVTARGPAGRRLVWLLVVFSVAALLSVVSATPAAAHGQLAMSQPAKDSTVSEPLESVLMYYTEKPPSNAHFTVTSPSGVRLDGQWSHAEPKRLDKPIQEYFLVNGQWEPRLYPVGFGIRVPVGYWPEQGLYTARYLSVASDGEEVRGEVRFTYTGPTSPAPAGWSPRTNEADPGLLAELQRGGTPSVVAPSGTATAAPPAPTAAADDAAEGSGVGIWVWLIPAFLLIGVGVVVLRAGSRGSTKSLGLATPGSGGKTSKTVPPKRTKSAPSKGKSKGAGRGSGGARAKRR